jgi:glucose-specific phosphotransferase system IIA component
MAKDFGKTARGVLDAIGGKGNIRSVVHCATRLRFTLVDNAKADDDAVKATSGVVSVVTAGGLYQVVIGNDARKVFEELEKRGAPTGGSVSDAGGLGEKQSVGDRLIGTISGVFTPILRALTGIGTIKGKPGKAEMKTADAVVIDISKVNTATAKKIYAPVKGRVLPITQSADAAHQQEAVGKGVCFLPLGGKIFAPCDGKVGMVFDTRHAISIVSQDGVEVLVHCGIDTVQLGGKGFTPHVKDDDEVKTGQLILEYDKNIIARAGFNLETQVVITNSGDYKAITQAQTGDCVVGDLVLYVE